MSKLKEKLGTEKYKQFLELIKDTEIKENEVDLLDGYIPRTRYNEISDKYKTSQETVETYKKQVEETKSLLNESEKFKEESEQFKNKYSDLETKYNSEVELKNKEIENILKRSLVKERLIEKNAKYPDLLLKQINLDDVSIKDDKLFGFDDTLKSIEESYKEMFPSTENTGNPSGGGGNNNNDGGDEDYSYLDNIKS